MQTVDISISIAPNKCGNWNTAMIGIEVTVYCLTAVCLFWSTVGNPYNLNDGSVNK